MAATRVLQVFTIMNRGGAEAMIMNYYRNIDRSKIQFDFLVHRNEKGAFEKEIESMGGRIYRLSAINPFMPSAYFKELNMFFERHTEYQIVHSHLNTFSKFPLKVAKSHNIPVRIAHAHIALEPMSLKDLFFGKENPVERVKHLVKLYLRKRVKTYATHLFACGNKAGKWLYGENSKFTQVNNAISTEAFLYNPKTRKSLRAKLGLNGILALGHVGRFTSQKNHVFLLHCLNDLVKNGEKNVTLLLIGDGPLMPEIKREIDKLNLSAHVELMGVRDDIPDLLQAMDIFVFPSHYEGLPVTLIESQAAGLKVLASENITKEVRLTNNIEFLPINSTKPWVNGIKKNESYERQNQFNRIADGGYDIKTNVKLLQEFYFKAINQNTEK